MNKSRDLGEFIVDLCAVDGWRVISPHYMVPEFKLILTTIHENVLYFWA